jgi:hypothetical protein
MFPLDQQKSTHGKSQADFKNESRRHCRTLKRITLYYWQQKIVKSAIFCTVGQNKATYYRV